MGKQNKKPTGFIAIGVIVISLFIVSSCGRTARNDDSNENSLSVFDERNDEEISIDNSAAMNETDGENNEEADDADSKENSTTENTDQEGGDGNNDIIDENTDIPEEVSEVNVSEEVEEAETENDKNAENVDFRAWVDSYEAFINTYIDFMKNYDSMDMSEVVRYTELMSDYAEFVDYSSNLKEEDFSVSDWAYYMEAYARIMNRLSEVQ